VYLNGKLVPRTEATLDIEDRGALFADGVYEVVRYYRGRARAMERHVARLRNSLEMIGLPWTPEVAGLPEASDALVKRNAMPDAKLYWQITRGAAPRDHVYPKTVSPTVLAISYPAEPLDPGASAKAVKCILLPDERWQNCHIKSLMLLPNVIAKNKAVEVGAYEAILHRDGQVTEGTSASLFVVIGKGSDAKVVTHPESRWILPGVTRSMIIELAHGLGINVEERPYSVEELLAADEVFLTGTTTHVAGVVLVDEKKIADGKVGSVTQRLQRAFLAEIVEMCGR
jgi:D-alanine transaminase